MGTMKTPQPLLLLAPAIAVAVLLSACARGTVNLPVVGPVELYPTAEPLTGDMPIGRWDCFDGNTDYERVSKSNRFSSFDARCSLGIWIGNTYLGARSTSKTSVAFKPDGTGRNMRAIHKTSTASKPDDGFLIEGSPNWIYSEGNSFRWELEGTELTVYDRDQRIFATRQPSDDAFYIVRIRNARLDTS